MIERTQGDNEMESMRKNRICLTTIFSYDVVRLGTQRNFLEADGALMVLLGNGERQESIDGRPDAFGDDSLN